MEYEILKPRKQVQSKPPVIFMIHGYGSDRHDLFSFADELPKKYCIISIQAPIDLPWGGYAWYHINFDNGEKFTDVSQAEKSRDSVVAFIDEVLQKYELDENKVVLLGFSQGAILSYGIAFKYPHKVNYMITLSGYVLPEFVLKGEKPEYKNISVFAAHGVNDGVIPIQLARQIPIILKEKHIVHSYKEYQMEHNINPECFRDMLNWIKKID